MRLRDLQILRPIPPGTSRRAAIAARLGHAARVYALVWAKGAVGVIAIAGIIYLLTQLGVFPQWQLQTEYSAIGIVLAFTAGSLVLTGAVSFMGFRYSRALQRSKATHSDVLPSRETSEPPRDASPLSVRQAVSVPTSSAHPEVEKVRKEVLAVNASVRRAYVSAWLAYTAVVAAVIIWYANPKIGWDGRLAITYATLAPQLMILGWSIRIPIWKRLLIFLAYAVAGIVLLALTTDRTLTVIRVVAGPFALFPMAGLVFLFIRRVQPFVVLLTASFIFFFGFSIVLDRLQPEVTAGARAALVANPLLVPLGLVNILFAVLVTRKLLTMRWPARGIAIAAALAGAVLLERDLVHHSLPAAVRVVGFLGVAILQVFLLWFLFKLLLWFQERRVVTREIVHTHICWAFLTLYLLGTTMASKLFVERIAVRWGFVLALAMSIATLHALLLRIRRRRPRVSEKRLLLLRVSGRANDREDLLDDLKDTWRRLGPMDLIAATDVASRTLQSAMLEAFRLRRSEEQFLTSQSIEERIGQRRSEIDGDARYPINLVYCYANTWQSAFTRLASDAAVLLGDVRGFTASNAGMAWELAYVLARVDDPKRIVLIVDRCTDLQALDQIARAAGAEREFAVLNYDRPSTEARRALFDLLLNAAHA
jgi:hypothetical protein